MQHKFQKLQEEVENELGAETEEKSQKSDQNPKIDNTLEEKSENSVPKFISDIDTEFEGLWVQNKEFMGNNVSRSFLIDPRN